MEMVGIRKVALFVVCVMLMAQSSSQISSLTPSLPLFRPPRPPHPLCLSQFALANQACGLLPPKVIGTTTEPNEPEIFALDAIDSDEEDYDEDEDEDEPEPEMLAPDAIDLDDDQVELTPQSAPDVETNDSEDGEDVIDQDREVRRHGRPRGRGNGRGSGSGRSSRRQQQHGSGHGHRQRSHDSDGDEEEHHEHRRHRRRHRRHHHSSPDSLNCCKWLQQLDATCVCELMFRMPVALRRPEHSFTVKIDENCNVTFNCPGRFP